jgi:Uncharacterized protein containing a Zn-ribbon (DUF2116)
MFLKPYSTFQDIERCINNKIYRPNYMNKKGHCKNCGDQIDHDSNSNEFCSEQCGVEYQLEHR